MRALKPYLALYRRHIGLMTLGIVLAIVTLLASIGLLTLSGWFLSASALAGIAGLYSFNYMLPAAGVRGAAIIRTAGRYFERLVSHDATFRVLQHLRVFTFRGLLPLFPAGLKHFRQADLLNRLVADVDALDHVYLRAVSPLIGALVTIVAVTFGLSWLSLPLALILGAILLLTLLLLPPLFWRAGKPAGEALTYQKSVYRQQLIGWLDGQAELAIFGAEKAWRDRLEHTERRWFAAQRAQAGLSALAQALMLLISGLTAVLMLWLAAGYIDLSSNSGALIALFVFCALAAFEALTPVTGAFQHLGQVIASAQRLTQILQHPIAITFPQRGAPHSTHVTLSLHDVSFSYPDEFRPVLQHISLRIAPGQRIAILGSTGCGKSTLLQLVTRAWDPTSGVIMLNETPLCDYDEATLRAMMTLVPQRVHLFSATLRDNLRLAAPQASDAAFQRALTQVGLQGLLENSGLDAWLGEGGRQLSGGELRRIGLARALLHAAPLILLDEPTEGLDAETESQILALLQTLEADKSLIMVTHRLTGLSLFDNIIVMDDGRILEQGSHDALRQIDGRYAQFLQRL